jgi:hypothetical protein
LNQLIAKVDIGGFVASREMWENVLLIQAMFLPAEINALILHRKEDIAFCFGLVFVPIPFYKTEM